MHIRLKYLLGVLVFFALCLFLSFNRHTKFGYFNYHSELWADKAGYYVYLPAAFIFDFDPLRFPDSIDEKTGNGFFLDIEDSRIFTKYTYGVALMQLPFFITADILAEPLNYERNGFSPVYQWSVNVASVFYLVLGLFFLTRFLAKRFGLLNAFLASLSVFLATNLFYYGIDETGMSHVYSFCLFTCFLYLNQATGYLTRKNFLQSLAFGLLAGLIVLIRPTNIIILTSFLFLDLDSIQDIKIRIKRIISIKTLLPAILGILIIFLPQMLYWKYASGSPISYSYGSEGFNWLNPDLVKLWFSPRNGLFTYTPFFLVIIISTFLMVKKRKADFFYLSILFLLTSYIFSSWWAWHFGCAFGSRSYVEYYSVFSIPVAYAFQKIRELSLIKKISFYFIILIFISFNLKMTYSYDKCFYGDHDWDWKWYSELVVSPTK